jgi:CheY-like chemotaxis protein/HPt (histidine-containing phosphotransfer) domain-containing protein
MIRDASARAADSTFNTRAADVRASMTSTLAHQAAVGVSAHLLFGALTVGATLCGYSSSVNLAALGLTVATTGAARVLTARSFASLQTRDPARWRSEYRGSAILSSVSLSLGTALALPFLAFDGAPWLLLFALAGVAVAGLALVNADVALLRLHDLCMRLLAPSTAGLARAQVELSPTLFVSPPVLASVMPSAPRLALVPMAPASVLPSVPRLALVPKAPAPATVPPSGTSLVAASRSRPAPGDRAGARVLIAEDAPANQVLMTAYLRKMGASVDIAHNGRIAVEMASEGARSERPFDLILMDMQMPELDGYEATARLRTLGYTGPIVAVTAHAVAGDREKCLAAGCDEYVTKPIKHATFCATVERFLALSRSRLGDGLAFDATIGAVAPPARIAILRSELADDPDLKGILPDFLNTLEGRVAALCRASGQEDSGTLKRLAHQLKGVAGGYGFPTITEQAKVLEGALESEHKPAVKAAVDALCTLCLRAARGTEAKGTSAAA